MKKHESCLHQLCTTQIDKFLAEAEQTECDYLLRFLLLTGLRVSEAIALMWSDIDFVKGTITVNRRQIGTQFEPPKGGSRVVSPPPLVMKLLWNLKNEQEKSLFVRSREHQSFSDWANTSVFTKVSGKPFDYQSISTAAKHIFSALGLGTYNIHDLRYTACGSCVLIPHVSLCRCGAL